MDQINQKILSILQSNGRIPLAALAKQVHLSAPAVAERVKRLEESGVIKGYAAQVDLDAVGLPIVAHIQALVFLGKEKDFISLVRATPCIVECDNVTGEKAFIMKVAVATMKALDSLLEEFSEISETNSMIVLSSIIEKT